MQLVLSLFTGIGLLDKAFKEDGFCVVSSGDLITGQDVRDFRGVKNKFDGLIGGSPCQDFSKANRNRPELNESYGLEMLNQFKRIVLECNPNWALLENVSGVPNLEIEGYKHQRIDINQSWYEDVNRLRHIQFYYKEPITPLQIERGVTNRDKNLTGCALASDGRSFKELKKLQGLNDDFDLPSFNVQGKKRAVGNGVPLSIGRVLARAVKSVTVQDNFNAAESQLKYCLCGCGRVVTSNRAKYYDFSCRKRKQRSNKNKMPGRVTL